MDPRERAVDAGAAPRQRPRAGLKSTPATVGERGAGLGWPGPGAPRCGSGHTFTGPGSRLPAGSARAGWRCVGHPRSPQALRGGWRRAGKRPLRPRKKRRADGPLPAVDGPPRTPRGRRSRAAPVPRRGPARLPCRAPPGGGRRATIPGPSAPKARPAPRVGPLPRRRAPTRTPPSRPALDGEKGAAPPCWAGGGTGRGRRAPGRGGLGDPRAACIGPGTGPTPDAPGPVPQEPCLRGGGPAEPQGFPAGPGRTTASPPRPRRTKRTAGGAPREPPRPREDARDRGAFGDLGPPPRSSRVPRSVGTRPETPLLRSLRTDTRLLHILVSSELPNWKQS